MGEVVLVPEDEAPAKNDIDEVFSGLPVAKEEPTEKVNKVHPMPTEEAKEEGAAGQMEEVKLDSQD